MNCSKRLNFGKCSRAALVALAMLVASPAIAFAQTEISGGSSQQAGMITGKVVDESGEPIIGATVMVAGTNNGTSTDVDGKFTIKAKKGTRLSVTYVGMADNTITLDGTDNVVITLVDNAKVLNEVVVMGYGVQKKKLVTGATLHVGGSDLAKLNSTTVLSALQSQSPGVNITQETGEPGDGFKVNIRGMGTIGNAAPLYVIDGIAGGDINTLNPADIEAIDILKDAASCAIYGARAANGVILITTKQGESGKIKVTYDGYLGWQNLQRMPQLLDARQYVDMVELATFNTGDRVIDWKEVLADRYDDIMSGKDKGTNWLENILNKNAAIHNHAINIAGGNGASKFSMGVSFSSQDGIIGKPVASHYEHTTARINSEHVLYKAGDRDIIKVGETLFYSYDTRNGIGKGDQNWNDISFMLRATPLMPIYGSDGNYYDWNDYKDSPLQKLASGFVNPIAEMVYLRGNNVTKNHSLNASPTS